MGDLPLHLAKFDLGSNVSLVIESALGTGEPVASPLLAIPNLSYAELERDDAKVSSGGISPMRWSETDVLFEQFQLREDTSYFVDVTLPISLEEARLQARSHGAWPFDERLANVFERDPPRRWKEFREDQKVFTTITGQLLLRSHAGIIRFSTPFGSALTAEVACRKFKYFEEFRTLLDDVATKMAELLLAYDSPLSLSFGYGVDEASNDAALYFQMRHVMSESMLPLAVDEIIQRPHVRLIEQNEVCLVEDLVEADPEVILDEIEFSTSVRGGPLSRFFGGFTPRELPQRVTFETVDTPENQYAKAFLENCKRISRTLQIRMLARKRRAAVREAEIWESKLDEILQKDLWRQVGSLQQIPSNSQVLLRKRGYKELVKCDLSLRMSLALPWQQGAEFADGLIGDVRPVNQIYEYWCFLSLFEILDDFCRKIDGENFVVVSKDGLRVQLARGQSSESRFEFLSADGVTLKVSLFYNRSFRRPGSSSADWKGSYTTTFNPDFSIAVAAPGVGSPHWLHFDAKYRT